MKNSKISFWKPTKNHRVIESPWHSNLGVYDEIDTPSIKFKVFRGTGKNAEKWWYGGNPLGSFRNEIYLLDPTLTKEEAFEIALKEKHSNWEKEVISENVVVYTIPGEQNQFSSSGFCPLKYKVEFLDK